MLALHLLAAGQRVRVFDVPARNQCSAVAAGLFNPLTGKVMSLTWLAQEIFGYLPTFYAEMEKKMSTSFFHPQPIYRPFLSAPERTQWLQPEKLTPLAPFLEEVVSDSRWSAYANDPWGGLLLRSSGYVNTPAFLEATRHYLIAHSAFEPKMIDPARLKTEAQHVTYDAAWQARHIVFCPGHELPPLFDWVPVRPLQGEILEVEAGPLPPVVFNRGVYVVPTTGGRFAVGATYTHGADASPTAAGRAWLESRLSALLRVPFRVVHHRAGIRPTSPDRRPLAGAHPAHPPVYLFTGLGTKGISLAPYFSKQLTAHLCGTGELSAAVNISRFYPLYSKPETV